jgi:hypothetical protein
MVAVLKVTMFVPSYIHFLLHLRLVHTLLKSSASPLGCIAARQRTKTLMSF